MEGDAGCEPAIKNSCHYLPHHLHETNAMLFPFPLGYQEHRLPHGLLCNHIMYRGIFFKFFNQMLDEMFGLKIHILGKTNEAKKLDLISQSHPENMHDTKNI